MSTTIREQLRTLSFLDGLTDTALHQLSRLVKPAEYECDALLFTEGSERKLLAIVVSGAVAPDSDLIAHHARHGDGVVDIALEVPDVDQCIAQARKAGATVLVSASGIYRAPDKVEAARALAEIASSGPSLPAREGAV